MLGVGSAVEHAGLSLSRLALGATVVAGAALVGLGVVATKMAADFQQSMTLLVTSAGESQKNIKMVGDGILQMSVQTATSSDKLATAMFNIESAGYRGASGLAVLKAAAEGAKIENANLDQVTQALTTTMHDWREPANQAVDVMNSFREAASIGTMRMDDFVGAMKNVGPVASLAKIPLTDVEAALSTMSLEGDKGAAAGTHLAQSLLNMISPSTKAKGVLKEIGMTAQQVSDDMQKSLPQTLKDITDAIGKKFPAGSQKYNEALSAMFGGTRGLKAILELTGANLKDFQKDAADLAPIMKQNATNVEGWALVQKNLNFQAEAFRNAVAALFITLGTQLLPAISNIVEKIRPSITAFTEWLTKTHAVQRGIDFLSDTIGKIGAAFNTVFHPIQQATNAMKPLTDTFDRASGIISSTTRVTKPLLDAFDHAKSVISATTVTAKPFLDTFDRATGVLTRTGTSANSARQAINPFVAIFQGAANTINFFITVYSTVHAAIMASIPVFRQIWSVMQQIGGFLRDTFAPVWQELVVDFALVKQALQPIMPQLQFLAQVLGAAVVGAIILTVATLAGLIRVLAAVLKGIASFITGAIQFFSGLVQAITGIMDVIADVFFGRWGRIGADLDRVMHGILTMIVGIWNMARGVFIAAFGAIEGFAQGFASVLIGIFRNLSNILIGHSIIPDMVNAIVSLIASLPGRIGAFAGSIIGALTSPFQSAVSQIGGILSGIGGDVNNALGEIGNLINRASQVHIPGFASGIENFGGGLAYVHAGEVLTYLPPGTSVTPASRVSSGSFGSGGQPVQVNINIAGHRVAQTLLPDIVQAVRTQTGAKF